MRLSPYTSQLILLNTALVVYLFLLGVSQRTGGQHETRKVLQQVADYSKLPQVVDNGVDSLRGFYTSLLNHVKLHKLPFGYDVNRMYFLTDNGNLDLLKIKSGESKDVDLSGGATFVLRIYNTGAETYGESSCYLSLNSSNVWELNSSIITFLSFGEYDFFYFFVIAALPLLLLLVRRNGQTYGLAATTLFHVAIEATKRCIVSMKDDWLHVLQYLGILSTISVLAMGIQFYRIQAHILCKHDIFHFVFYRVAGNFTILFLSLSMIPFLHHLGVHVLYFFIWMPILCCMVVIAVGTIVKESREKESKARQAMRGNVNDDEKQSELKGKDPTLDPSLNPYSYCLMALSCLFCVVIIIFCFKENGVVDSMRTIYNAITANFPISKMCYHLETIPNTNGLALRAQNKARTVEMNLPYIRKTYAIKRWVKETLPIVNVLQQMCIITDSSGVSTKHKLTEVGSVQNVIERLKSVNVRMLLVFQSSSSGIVYSMLRFGNSGLVIREFEGAEFNSIDTAPEYVSIVLGSIMLLISLVHLLYNMKKANVLSNFSAFCSMKVKEQAHLVVLSIIPLVQSGFVICRFLISYYYVPETSKLFTEDKDPDEIVSLMNAIPWIRASSYLFLFSNVVITVLYIVVILPRYYQSITKDGEVIKRPITAKLSSLGVLLYQYVICLVLWSIFGNLLFGGNYYHMRTLFTAVRYNVILGFNKVLHTTTSRYISIYDGITVMLFYIIGLTSLLAVYFHYSWVKEQKVADLEDFDKFKDNFKVNIMANVDDITSFKLFIKSIDVHKECMERNPTEVDHWEVFFEKLNRDNFTGISQLKGKSRLNMYLERVKKYTLCILFLRMKMRKLSLDIKEMEELSAVRKPINESKRSYLMMLKQKLQLTVEEIQKFKRSREILITGQKKRDTVNAEASLCSIYRPQNIKDGNDMMDHGVSYDESELLNFVIRPDDANTYENDETGINGSEKCLSPLTCDENLVVSSHLMLHGEASKSYAGSYSSCAHGSYKEQEKESMPLVSGGDPLEVPTSRDQQTQVTVESPHGMSPLLSHTSDNVRDSVKDVGNTKGDSLKDGASSRKYAEDGGGNKTLASSKESKVFRKDDEQILSCSVKSDVDIHGKSQSVPIPNIGGNTTEDTPKEGDTKGVRERSNRSTGTKDAPEDHSDGALCQQGNKCHASHKSEEHHDSISSKEGRAEVGHLADQHIEVTLSNCDHSVDTKGRSTGSEVVENITTRGTASNANASRKSIDKHRSMGHKVGIFNASVLPEKK